MWFLSRVCVGVSLEVFGSCKPLPADTAHMGLLPRVDEGVAF